MSKCNLNDYFLLQEIDELDASVLDLMPSSIRKDMIESGIICVNDKKEKTPNYLEFDPIVFDNSVESLDEELLCAIETENVKVIWKHIRYRRLSVALKLKIIELKNNGLVWGILKYQLLDAKVQNAVAKLNNRDFFIELLKCESLGFDVQKEIVKTDDTFLIKKLFARSSTINEELQKEIITSCKQKIISMLIDKGGICLYNQFLLYRYANRENIFKYQDKGGFSYVELKELLRNLKRNR